MTPSKIGPRQMKFSAVPCSGQTFIASSDSDNLLGENLAAQLSQKEACFDFKVQLRTLPDEMPIEDPTIEWNEQDAPFRTVARIRIPTQQLIDKTACQDMSLNPWNTLPELRPLGGINRVRKEVYREISRLRRP
jgi:hypothetical protein